MADSAQVNAFPTPAWWNRCRQALVSGSTKAIILHLNTRDYAVPGKHLTTYLCKLLANRDVVAIYNRATGITFPLESMEQRARDLLGMNRGAQGGGNAAQSATLAALGLGGGNQGQQQWPRQPSQALPMLERLMLSGARVTVIVEYAETLLPAADLAALGPDDRDLLVTLLRWGSAPELQASDSFAFLLVQNLPDLHPALRAGSSGYYAVEVPLPDREARLRFKAWAIGEIIRPVREGRLADMPQGVIFVGPPGTGKSYFVKGLARMLGFNAVALNMQNILGGIVGQPERNLARALAVVKSLAPCLVFMDELDQTDVSARGNASGNPVAKNLFNMLLQFLGDPVNRGRVVFFGASNRPDLMDNALMRFGRVDAIIPVLLPEVAERRAIAEAQARGQQVGISEEALDLIASESEKYSAADVAQVVIKARKLARSGGAETVSTEHAGRALRALRPATLQKADFFTMLAVQACNDTDLLPPALRGPARRPGDPGPPDPGPGARRRGPVRPAQGRSVTNGPVGDGRPADLPSSPEEDLMPVSADPTTLERDKQELARILGAANIRTEAPRWLNLMREGVVVKLHVRRWRAKCRLDADDLGLPKEADDLIGDLLELGDKRLLPLDLAKQLEAIESAGRKTLERNGYATYWGVFVPATNFARGRPRTARTSAATSRPERRASRSTTAFSLSSPTPTGAPLGRPSDAPGP